MNASSQPERDDDSLSSASGSDPLTVGSGALLGGLAGTSMGTSPGGPVGGNAGMGVVTGGLAGAAISRGRGKPVNPDEEDAHWREEHSSAPYAVGESYELYEPAYRAGYEGFQNLHGDSFAEVEDEIRKRYESHKEPLPWEKARPAARAAWERLAGRPPHGT